MNIQQLFDFQQFTPEFAENITKELIANSQVNLEKIYAIPVTQRNFSNTLAAYDDILNELSNVASVEFLLFCTSPDESLRQVCNENSQKIQQFSSELVLDAQLYEAVKQYASTEEAKNLHGYQQKMLQEVLRDFQQNGLALPEEQQTILKDLQGQLIALSSEFQKNTSEITDFLMVSETEMAGLPEDYKKQHKEGENNHGDNHGDNHENSYKIDLSYPSYLPFMQYSESEDARKALSFKYLNRAADKNLDVLQKVLVLRKQVATMLGFPSYAAQCHSNLMSKTPQTVWNFELDLVEKVRVKAKIDYQELLACKNEYVKENNTENHTIINSWETGFYRNILLKTKYNIDNQIVKQYFEANNVLQGIFNIASKLFGIEFIEQKNITTWHEEVRFIEVKEQGKLIGKMYLDLFPRANKYNHAACFPLISGKELSGNELSESSNFDKDIDNLFCHSEQSWCDISQESDVMMSKTNNSDSSQAQKDKLSMSLSNYQTPILALVCNFPPATADKPSLLTHNDVETFFHEFGHALHVLLTTSPVSMYAGTNTKRDFVEVPSQWFEAWAWNYEALSLFAKHHESGEVLPKELFDKMLATKNLGSGLFAQSQLFYAIYDLTLHDTYQPENIENGENSENTTDILKKLQNNYTQFPYKEGTHFQAAFGHLMGYAASYYGYMWAKVYAEDCAAKFEKHGMFDLATGKKFRESILAKGGSTEEFSQIVEFLGREPNSKAFLKSLGI